MKNKFNERLVALRKESKLLQKQLASELGVTQVCVAKWETGDRQPSLDMLMLVARYFSVTTDYLLGLED